MVLLHGKTGQHSQMPRSSEIACSGITDLLLMM